MCASVPAVKPLVVKIFPKLLLSDLYARTKGTYGSSDRRYGGGSKREANRSTAVASGNRSCSQSNALRSIQVE